MKKTIKKLEMRRETVRVLAGHGLRGVVGGTLRHPPTTGSDACDVSDPCNQSGITACITRVQALCSTVPSAENCPVSQ